jgi:1,4-dihydroxy-2-naphthoate octaprenyltransferase
MVPQVQVYDVRAVQPPLIRLPAADVVARGLNYFGQLRCYSYSDLLLMLLAVGATAREVVACSLLWFGFLIHLEWRHRDRGRLHWPWYLWVAPWVAAVALVPDPRVLPFLALATGYSLKKRFPAVGAVSPLLNGGLKAALVILIPGVPASTVLLIFGVMAVRNLLGDIRDARKDAEEGVRTIPVLLGYRRATPLIYPLGVAATSALWVLLGDLPLWTLVVAWLVQLATYHLTPR